jgi:molybdenum cofactor cytidylyltransferase
MSTTESVILLAAGSSSRLGQSKQLLKTREVPLLLNTVKAALDAEFKHVVVVLGSNFEAHKAVISHLPVDLINHIEWNRGMGSSLKCGLTHLLKSNPDTSAIVITVCDQPFLKASHLKKLSEKYHQASFSIVASQYNHTLGVPALFDRSLFDQLLNLEDSQGAKVVIQKNKDQVTFVDWPEGHIDIDTVEDLRHLPD